MTTSMETKVALIGQQLAVQEKTLTTLANSLADQAHEQRAFNEQVLARLSHIDMELTARKEFGRGLKTGAALFWATFGGAVLAIVSKLHTILGAGTGGPQP